LGREGERRRSTCNFTIPLEGRITVLKLKLRGAIGVRRNASVSGWEMGPPEDKE